MYASYWDVNLSVHVGSRSTCFAQMKESVSHSQGDSASGSHVSPAVRSAHVPSRHSYMCNSSDQRHRNYQLAANIIITHEYYLTYLGGSGTNRIHGAILSGGNADVRTSDRGRTGKGRIDVISERQKSFTRDWLLRQLLHPLGIHGGMVTDAYLACGGPPNQNGMPSIACHHEDTSWRPELPAAHGTMTPAAAEMATTPKTTFIH